MIASNFVPGLGQAKWAIKGAKAGLKASKAVKTIRYARSLKVTKKIKVAAKSGWNSFKNSRTYKAINNERGSIRLGRGVGKSRNKPKQSGIPNSTEFVRGSDGKISKYTTFGDRGQLVKEVRVTGKGHDNIPRPNVKEPKFNVNPKTGQQFQNGYQVRPAKPNELPQR